MNSIVLALMLMLTAVVSAQTSISPSRLSTLRIRLFKDLNSFPDIQNAKIKQMSENIFSIDGLSLKFQNKKLSNKNFIVKKQNRKFDIIAVVDFNTYLAGVVSKEMPLKWPLEALKTQAVVARSYALSKIQQRQNKIFHLDNDQMDQVFDFTTSEKAKRAVVLTDQIVLKDQNNKILKAFYHSDCGGQTVPADQVWKGAADMGTAIDPWCANRRSNQWNYEISKDQFYQKLDIAVSDEDDVQIAEKFKNRIQSVQVLQQIIPVQKLREIFGFSEIRNSPTEIQQNKQAIILKGKGFGHGAGLCQWGTLAQANLGRNYQQILEHYYPKATITNSPLKLSQVMMSDLVFN